MAGVLTARGDDQQPVGARMLGYDSKILGLLRRRKTGAVGHGHQRSLRVEELDLQVDPFLSRCNPQELTCLKLDGIALGVSAMDLSFLSEAIVEERFSGRSYLRAAGEDGEKNTHPTGDTAAAERDGVPHSFVCLSGFTALAPASF
jgi:hypothetical protein